MPKEDSKTMVSGHNLEEPNLVSLLAKLPGRSVRFMRNQTIYSEGDQVTHVYVVKSGAVRVCHHRRNGQRQILNFLLPGDILGLQDSTAYVRTSEATAESIAVVYSRQDVSRLQQNDLFLERSIFAQTRALLAEARALLTTLGCQTAEQRVATFLLELSERTGGDEGDTLPLPMTRQDIADYLGLTIETVCRVLSDMRRRGLITATNQREVVIRDMPTLKQISEGAHGPDETIKVTPHPTTKNSTVPPP